MDNPNPIYYKDLITPDDSITKLIGQLDDLITTYEGAKSKIQGAANDVAKSLQGVSGATEEQRKAIQLATEESDKLVKEYRDISKASWTVTQALEEQKAAKKEAAQIDKLITQINTSAEGSYNKLSAQYRLNKIRLNEMSLAERQGTEAGKALEAETKAIYEEMKRLQEATGKHQLNVGNYADAAKELKMELRSLTQQMAYLRANGQENTQEYQDMAQRAGQLKDAMQDANEEINAMASDTQALNTTMGAASAASGGMNAVTGTMALMGQTSETATDAQKNLGAAIGIVSGLTAVQTALQKESNLMTGIRVLQTKAATKAEQLDTAAKKKDIVATTGATIAQRIFNAVAAANPYVLLALALVTVVGALVALAAGANRAAKEQVKLNKATAAQLDYMDQYAKSATRANNERIQELNNELEIAKARNAGFSETRKLEDEIYNERVKAHDKQMEIYAEQVNGLDANRSKLEQLQKTLLQLQQAQAAGKNRLRVDVDLDGKVENTKIEKAIEAVQGQIDNLGRSVQIAVDLKTEGAEISTERAVQLAERRNQAQQAAKTETDILRAAQDARLALIADSYKREQKILEANAKRQIEDIKTRLRTESNLTKKARQALNDQMKTINEKYYRDLADLQNKYLALDVAATRETEDIRIALMAEGADKQRAELKKTYERQIQDLETAVATQRDLTEKQVAEMYEQSILLGEQYKKELAKLNAEISLDQLNSQADAMQLRLDATREGSQEQIDLTIELLKKQREIELAENAQLAEDVRQKEADINAKWDAVILKQTTDLTQKRALMLLDMQQELAASEMALLDKNERQKTQFQLAQEKARLQKILDLDAVAGVKMTEQERKTIENTIKAIEKETAKLPYNNIFELLGISLDSNQQDSLNTAINTVKESLTSLADAWVQTAESALSAADAQVAAAQKALDAEIEARNAGYANNVKMAQKELALAKSNQDKALKEKEKAQRAQLLMDSLEQASSLITATANIWKAFSGAGVVGIALAAVATATMWGAFLAAKIKAAQITQPTETYGDGTVELLQGGSHASGHDIDLGTKPDGTKRRAEGGEFFAVINKRNSRRFREIIPDVINSFNDGTFAARYQRANTAMAGYAVSMIGGGTTDVSTLERDVAKIREQGEENRYIDADGNMIIQYRNLTRRIKKN